MAFYISGPKLLFETTEISTHPNSTQQESNYIYLYTMKFRTSIKIWLNWVQDNESQLYLHYVTLLSISIHHLSYVTLFQWFNLLEVLNAEIKLAKIYRFILILHVPFLFLNYKQRKNRYHPSHWWLTHHVLYASVLQV
jgi:hypothetical protein